MGKSLVLNTINNWGDYKIVGLGESVHGSASIHEAIFNELRILIQSHEVLNIGFEMPPSTMEFLNQFVTGKLHSLAEHFGHVYGIFRDQSFRDFLLWLQDFNSKVQPPQQVRVFGFDVRDPWITGKASLQNYAFKSILTPEEYEFLKAFDKPKFYELEALGLEASLPLDVRSTLQSISLKADTALRNQRSDKDLIGLKFGMAYISAQDANFYTYSTIRDQGMFELFLEHFKGLAGKTALVGHLFHLAKNTHDRQIPNSGYRMPISFGQHLSEKFGSSFVSVGISIRGGKYMRTPDDVPTILADHESCESEVGTFSRDELKRMESQFKYLGKLNVLEGIDIDDSRVPLKGPISDLVDALIVIENSQSIELLKQ